MLKIGLTGGIGCGKTTVARLFAGFGVPIIDADDTAHRLVAIGQPALASITQEFGPDILNPDGSLNRNTLREEIFSNSEQKQKLESILHPLVYKAIQSEIEKLNAKYCIICVPLLLETGMGHFVDRILVVDCPVEIQIARVKSRDNLTLERIQSIIDNQVSRAFRKSKADDIIDNSETDYRLAEQVKKLHNLYLSLSI
ncbi:MAG: dephospho-CoA kinase [Methylobacter sp.]|nr:dephospho-CoA kinase [Methylobacter sp.]